MSSDSRHQSSFLTTRWTRVCLAKADTDDGRRALTDLCDAYYQPVVAFLRCELRDLDDAREMSHAFFAQMLAGGTISTAERDHGRFRSYLLGSVKHFLSNQRALAAREKRGGGAVHHSLEDEQARWVADDTQLPADIAFDRQWARTLLERSLDSLQSECASKGKSAFYEAVRPWLTGDSEHGDQHVLAESLGMNLNTLKGDILRLKRRFRDRVKEEIAGTLRPGESVEEEMAVLFAVLRNS